MTSNDRDEMIQEMVDDLVVRGSDDWVPLAEVDWVVNTNADRHQEDLSIPERITTGVEVIRRVLDDGLMTVGDVYNEPPGFVPWVDRSRAIERIATGWRAAGANLELGDVCWLANTPKGTDYAHTVHDEVNARSGWSSTNA